jgi:hypothetical protein
MRQGYGDDKAGRLSWPWENEAMKGRRLLGGVLVVLGLLALAYGGFSYTRSSEKASIGPFQIEVQKKERVLFPVWAGLVVVAVGGILLVRRT